MKRIVLAAVLMFGVATSAWAGLDEDKAAAIRGDASAQFRLGVMYGKGEGVPLDYAEALKWYRKAAEQGHVRAQNNLGSMYHGGKGVPQDDAEARKWYRKAAERGIAVAQYNLGRMYALKAAEQALADKKHELDLLLGKIATRQGLANAQDNIDALAPRSKAVKEDYVQAYMWFNLAAAQGVKPAARGRDIIAKSMTPAQVAEAQRLTRGWKPKTQAAKAIPKSLATPPATSSDTIRSIQTNLAALGYRPGPADGILGPRTRSAIEAVQRYHDLPVTGERSALLRKLLLLKLRQIRLRQENAGQKPKKVELSD